MNTVDMTSLKKTLSEFKPTIFFLVRFLGIYVISNLLYGWFVTAWYPSPDPMTSWVTEQCTSVLNVMGWEVHSFDHATKPTTYIATSVKNIVGVYEGCNGLNVAIVFLSFVLAFGPYSKTMAWFIPLGLLVIHLSNLTRIVLLAVVSRHIPDFLYFTHKYLFTAFIYLFVFLLWIWWVTRLANLSEGLLPRNLKSDDPEP